VRGVVEASSGNAAISDGLKRIVADYGARDVDVSADPRLAEGLLRD